MTILDSDRHTQALSKQALATYFLTSTEKLQVEETAEEFMLHIPKLSFAEQQSNTTDNGNLSDRALKILEFAGCWVDEDESE